MKFIRFLLSGFLALSVITVTPIYAEETDATPVPTESAEPSASAEPTVTPDATPEASASPSAEPSDSPLPAATAESFAEPTAQPESTAAPEPADAENYTGEWQVGEGTWTIQDVNENDVISAGAAAADYVTPMIKALPAYLKGSPIHPTEAGALVRDHRIATYTETTGYPGYVSFFKIGSRAAFCIEPNIQAAVGGSYTGNTTSLWDLNYDQAIRVGRALWFGYGHAQTGTSDDWYMATQLLIWKIVDEASYNYIIQSLKYCTVIGGTACEPAGDAVDLSAKIAFIENLIDNYDTVPSFGDYWHGVKHYDLDWNETLELTDTTGVLNWYNDDSEETHNGIHLKVDGNTMKIDIDSLYYDGYNTDGGKTLTFKRTAADWQNYQSGLLVWENGAAQKLMTASYRDPSPLYKLSFSLKRANLALTKEDEYYTTNNFTAGTQYIAGWYEDPETQYEHDGDADNNWTDIHDWNKDKTDDTLGEFGIYDGVTKYYPIMTEDGSAIRTFTVGGDGILHIDDLLPQNKKWWIKEVGVSNPYLLDGRVISFQTGAQNTTTSMGFVNQLRDITLDVSKVDAEDHYIHLNGATYNIYEVAANGQTLDLSKENTKAGTEVNLNRGILPTLTYQQLKDHAAHLAVDETFLFNGYLYTITGEGDSTYIVQAVKAIDSSYLSFISRYPFLEKAAEGDTVTICEVQKPHATTTDTDDTAVDRTIDVHEINPITATITEADPEKNIAVSESTSPSLTDLLAADANPKAGDHITLSGTGYSISEVQTGEDGKISRIIINPDQTTVLDRNDPTPYYWEIPNVRSLKSGNTFTLGDGIYKTDFTVTGSGAWKLNLSASYQKLSGILVSDLPEEQKAAALAGTLKKGDTYTNEGTEYTVYSTPKTESKSVLVTDLPQDVQEKIQNGTAQVGDVFALDETSYLLTALPEDPALETASVTAVENGTVYVSAPAQKDITLDVPAWIDYANVPDTVTDAAELAVKQVINPVYTVQNTDTGAVYTISDSKILLNNADGSTTQITDGSVIGYLDLVYGNAGKAKTAAVTDLPEAVQTGIADGSITAGSTFTGTDGNEYSTLSISDDKQSVTMIRKSITADNGGACEDPYEIHGCPIGTGRTYTHVVRETAAYSGAQYEEIPEAETLTAGDTFDANGITYTIVTPVDPVADPKAITVQWTEDGLDQTAVLTAGTKLESYTHARHQTDSYEITDHTDKEVILTWTNAVNGKGWIISDRDFKIRSYTDSISDLDLTYDKLGSNAAAAVGSTFTYDNGTYTVLFNDTINKHMIVKDSNQSWYELTEDGIQNYEPITYDQYLQKETENGKAYKTADPLTNSFTRQIVVDDDFTIENTPYTLTEKKDKVSRTVVYPWEENAPYSWSEILTKLNGGTEFTEQGVTYSVSTSTAPKGNPLYTLSAKDADGNTTGTWNYGTFILANDDPNRQPYEQLNPIYPLTVNKPGVISYSDFQKIYPQGDAKEGDTFQFKGSTYQIIALKEGQVVLQNTSTKESITLKEAETTSYETHPICFLEKGTSIDLSTVFPVPEKHEVTYAFADSTYAKATITDSTLTAEDISRFQINLCDAKTGAILDTKEFIVTSSNGGAGTLTTTDGLPVFSGTTGSQYLRLTDSTNHNMPLPYYSVTIYNDEGLTKKAAVKKTDGYGSADLSDLAAGNYYYQDPITKETRMVTVVNSSEMTGQLAVSSLKWGRTYMACEVGLPEGYDYSNDVCHTFTMNAASDTNVSTNELTNRLRRLKLKVYKVDQNDRSILLNNAWFAVSDVNDTTTVIDEHTSSSNSSLLNLSDIPKDAQVGDQILIWRAKKDGTSTLYTIQKVRKDEVVVSDPSGKEYWIPRVGFNEKAPMIWSDITTAMASDTLEEGMTFRITEKEPLENMQIYTVTAVARDTTADTSGNPLQVITAATVTNNNDSGKTPIELKAVQSSATYPADSLGNYVSGGILVEQSESVRSEPLIWSEILSQVSIGNLNVGTQLTEGKRYVVNLPSYSDVKKLVDAGTLKAGGTWDQNGQTWTLTSFSDEEAAVSLEGNSYVLQPATIAGAVEFIRNETVTVTQVYTDSNGSKIAVTVKDPEGQTSYIHQDNQGNTISKGKPGVYAEVSETSDMSKPVADGYTNAAGQLVFTGLADGTYYLKEENGGVQTVKVQKGTIFLPEVKYGHKIQICETQSPLGYIVGDACSIVEPKVAYNVDTVENYRTNKKIVWWEKGGRRVRIRKMGVDAE